MVKETKILVILLALAITISFVYAEETNVIVKTNTGYDYKITLGIYDIYGELIESQETNTSSLSGEALFNFSSASKKNNFFNCCNSKWKNSSNKEIWKLSKLFYWNNHYIKCT